MPHTSSRYQQDLSFTDGMLDFSAAQITGLTVSGTAPTQTRNAVGDISWNLAASSEAYFDIDLLACLMRRSGFFEDLQNQFGSTFGGGLGGSAAGPSGAPGTGIPGESEVQGRPGDYILPGQPQPVSAMGALQEITPRTGLKLKGIKPKQVTVFYLVGTGAMSTLTCVLTQTAIANGVALAKTTLLVSGANGLTNVAAATPYATTIQLPNAMYYQVTPGTQLWFELHVVSPASNTFQLYGVELGCSFNFN